MVPEIFASRILRLLLVSLFALSTLITHPTQASADQRTIFSLTELNEEKLFLGDIIEFQTGVCWSSKKPKSAASKIRLQIFANDKWQSVGRTKFVTNTQCTGNGRKIYEQVFVWEIDRLGEIDNRLKYLGTLRLRNAATVPSEYAKITILESREKLREFEASQTIDFFNWLNCQMNGGQWDDSRALCIGGSRP